MTNKQSKDGISRRSFVQTLGIGAATGALQGHAAARLEAQEADADLIGPAPASVVLRINGKPTTLTIEPATTLLDALRHSAKLTGSKEICDRGSCGGCSVMIDGVLTASCMMLAVDTLSPPKLRP